MNMFKIFLDESLFWDYCCFEHVQLILEAEIMHINNDTTIVVSYLVYLLISVTLTVWVARTLHKRGAIFLVDAFQGNAELAASVNHLLVGFYLINIGFVTLALKSDATVTSSRAAIEMLSDKLGFILLVLGGMHFFNLFVFSRIRAHGQHTGPRRPPVAPDAVLKVAVPR
jgi:hypothetical protein